MSGSDSEASASSQAPGGPVFVPVPPIDVLYRLISGPAPGAQPARASEFWRKEMSAGFGDFVKKWRWEMCEMKRVLADGVETIWNKPARLEPDVPASSGSPQGRWEWAPKIYSHGVESRKSRRPVQEDAVAVVAPLVPAPAAGEGGGEGDQLEFFAVYDGHGGSRVSVTCRERLHVALAEEMARLHLGKGGGGEEEEAARWREAMVAAFAHVDGEVGLVKVAEREKDPNSEHTEGSTAVVAVVGPRRIVVANCGDSRAVLCRGGAAVPLSTDHKPERPDERERIESVGGEIIYWQGPRVQGVLATSRSIGDYFLKPSVTAEPEVTVMERTVEDEFIILGSDGLWDAVSSEFACKLVRFCLSGRGAAKCPSVIVGSSTHDAARLLADFALWVGSPDNISVVVVELTRLTYVKKKVVAKLNGSRPLPPARRNQYMSLHAWATERGRDEGNSQYDGTVGVAKKKGLRELLRLCCDWGV